MKPAIKATTSYLDSPNHPPSPVALAPRLLLIEDDMSRIEKFRNWTSGLPMVLIEATSGGQAVGVTRFGGEGIAGICLDHDLNSAPRTQLDLTTSGSNVVDGLVRNFARAIPVLVHSMNETRAVQMTQRLRGAGFRVTRIRMAELDAIGFANWLQDVDDYWQGRNARLNLRLG